MPTPEQSSFFRGFQKTEITTAGHLFNPEELFALVHDINTRNKAQSQRRTAIELYPAREIGVFETIVKVGRGFGLDLPFPVGITAKRVKRWQKIYPEAEVERVHIEFWTTALEKAVRMSEISPKKWPNFLGMSIFFGSAETGYGVSLARELGLGVNIHGNNIDTLLAMGKLPKEGLKYVWGENGTVNSSPVGFLYRSASGLSDPNRVIDQVESCNLDGFLYGADHERDLKRDPSDNLTPKVFKHLRAVHIAERDHGEIRRGNEIYERFVRKLARSEHPHKVALVFDGNPLKMKKMTYEQKLDYYLNQIDWLWEVQDEEIRKLDLAA